MIAAPVDLAEPCSVVAYRGKRVRLIVVGAGGTGSWLVPHLARLTWDWNRSQQHVLEGRNISLLIIDHDHVTEKNVRARQNFCPPEIGFPKAQVLANRYALAFGLRHDEIAAEVEPFTVEHTQKGGGNLVIVVGCVDNAEARAQMAASLHKQTGRMPGIWYIDAGNGLHWGQVLIGNTSNIAALKGCLAEPLCARLPSPALLAPTLFTPPPAVTPLPEVTRLSCGDLVLLEQEGNRQSRTINAHMAALVYAYIEQLLYSSITTFATYTNLTTFQTHSLSVTAPTLTLALNQPADFASSLTTPVPDEDEEAEDLDCDEAE